MYRKILENVQGSSQMNLCLIYKLKYHTTLKEESEEFTETFLIVYEQ